jgi:methanogenic corrinoid protein MtbC1
VKRWVDEGILPAHRTPGGHRKVLTREVMRLVRERALPHQDLHELAVIPSDTLDPKVLRAQLLKALKAGDSGPVTRLIEGAYRAGMPLAVMADAVIAPVMQRLGHEWEKGRLDVLFEHRGTQLCAEALYGIKTMLIPGVSVERPLAIGGSPEGDPYLLANLLAELILLEAGWSVMNVGPNTPLRSFGTAVTKFRPRLLWLSLGLRPTKRTFLYEYEQMYRQSFRVGAALAIGGRGLTPVLRQRMPCTMFGDRLAHLAALASAITDSSKKNSRAGQQSK